MRKNITKINWLAYISYSGQDFRFVNFIGLLTVNFDQVHNKSSPPRVASDVSNLNESKKSLNSPEPFIKVLLLFDNINKLSFFIPKKTFRDVYSQFLKDLNKFKSNQALERWTEPML